MATETRLTGLVAALAEILWLIDNEARNETLAGRAAISAALTAAVLAIEEALAIAAVLVVAVTPVVAVALAIAAVREIAAALVIAAVLRIAAA